MPDPDGAPRRTDLPWLRHRSRRGAAPSGPDGAGVRYVHDRPKRTGEPSTRPPAPASLELGRTAAPAPAPPSFDRPAAPAPITFDRPKPASLDVNRPAAPASLDLGRPAAPASLDLDEATAPPPAARPPDVVARRAAVERVHAGQRRILTPDEPTVTLTRLQSGIGTLQMEAAVPPAAGDLQIGVLFELADGHSSTVDLATGRRTASSPQRGAVVVARKERFEQIAVDLRRSRDLRRLAVYARSAARQPLQWSGTVVVTTFGGGRVELPLEGLRAGATAVLLSVYNVRGEFVIRAEMEVVDGSVREAARAYGFDRITWLDDRIPVD
jgi:hypothetical protein